MDSSKFTNDVGGSLTINNGPFRERLPSYEQIPPGVTAAGEAMQSSIAVAFTTQTVLTMVAGGSMEMMWTFINAM